MFRISWTKLNRKYLSHRWVLRKVLLLIFLLMHIELGTKCEQGISALRCAYRAKHIPAFRPEFILSRAIWFCILNIYIHPFPTNAAVIFDGLSMETEPIPPVITLVLMTWWNVTVKTKHSS